MTLQQVVDLYNPDNARNLTSEQIQGMQSLDDEQIRALSEAYPNNPRSNAYLILFDKNLPANKQMFTLSTWSNLFRVRSRSGYKNLVAYNFRSLFHQPKQNQAAPRVPVKVDSKPLDLSAEEMEGMQNKAAEAGKEIAQPKPEKVKKERLVKKNQQKSNP